MKHFGNFLVDRGIISSSQLVQSLFEQLQSTPPSIVILHNRDCLGTQEVLDILSLQNEEQVDFRSACGELGLWEERFEKVLQSEISRERLKLGQILINNGWADPKQLLSDLMDFQSYRTKNNSDHKLEEPKSFDSRVVVSIDSPIPSSEEANPEIDSDYSPAFGQIESDSILDYLDLFSDEKKSLLESTILDVELLKDAEGLAGNAFEVLDIFFGDYHSLKGAARSVGAVLTEKLIHQAEDLLTFYKQFSEKVKSQDFVNLSEINLSVLDMLWELRTELSSFSTEEVFWGEDSTRKRYLLLLKDLQALLLELQGRNYQVSLDDVSDMF